MANRGGLSDTAFAVPAARQGLRRVAAGAARVLKPFGRRPPQKLLIAPQDIRTSDPTIAADIYAGQLKLAGKLLETHGRSPFELEPPSEAFAVELQGFSWLRHLRAADSALARANGRALVGDWINLTRGAPTGIAGRPDVTARRLVSWLSQTPLLLDGADAAFYRSFVKALAGDAHRLSRMRRAQPATEGRLMIDVALAHYALCASESDVEIRKAATQLCDSLAAQVLPDGGHVSRNPQVTISVLLDLLPLKLAFLWRRIQTPQPIVAAIDRMMPMLRLLRHADGAVALFNGMGATRVDVIAAILAQDDAVAPAPVNAPYAGYQRLERGGTVLIADAGAPPAPPLASRAHAAPLAFELSGDNCRIVVNCGAPPSHRPEAIQASRLTAAHSTLVIGEDSMGRFVRSPTLKALLGDQFTGGAREVKLQRADTTDGSLLAMEHDGWRKSHGFQHERRLALSPEGAEVEGEDALVAQRGARAVDYALRFHLHPSVKPVLTADQLSVSLTLPNGKRWTFEAGGLGLAIEESIFFASTEGLRRTEQIVVRANTSAHDRIAWSFRKSTKG